ncbi:MAG: hypothetical protein ACRCVI_03270 [Mycoplasmoidaceae bacterium]
MIIDFIKKYKNRLTIISLLDLSLSFFLVIFSIVGLYYLPAFDGWIAFAVIFGITFFIALGFLFVKNILTIKNAEAEKKDRLKAIVSIVCLSLITFAFAITLTSILGLYFISSFSGWFTLLITFGVGFLISYVPLIFINGDLQTEKQNSKVLPIVNQ